MNHRVYEIMQNFHLPDISAKVIDKIMQLIFMWKDESRAEELLRMIQDVIGRGHGVQTIQKEMNSPILAYYINMGDTYDMTVLVPTKSFMPQITAWGDWMVRNKL
jgi:hypothetical protein